MIFTERMTLRPPLAWCMSALMVLLVACKLAAAAQRPPPNLVAPSNAVPGHVLAWNADCLDYDAKVDEREVYFTFWVTNVSHTNVFVESVQTTCGCTVAQLPAQPWLLAPGSNGPVRVTVDLARVSGTLMKGINVITSAGLKPLVVRVEVPDRPAQSPAPVQAPPRARHDRLPLKRAN